MDVFVRKLITEWRRLGLPFAQETFILAVSGGADSSALACAIKDLLQRKKFKSRFILAHFNHGLRGDKSDKDENFVKELASRLELEVITEKADFAELKSNLEERAREARYEFLRRVAENYGAFGVLTAHTINDQAETFLMNLIRGSGTKGLSAMKPIREFATDKQKTLLIRPLLRWAKRTDTEEYCRRCNIEFCEDEMNEDPRFFRARIRHQLIPFLQSFNPRIVEVLARTANIIGEENEILEQIINNVTKEELKTSELKKFPASFRHRILRMWLEKQRGDLKGLSLVHIEAIERLALSRKSGRIVELPKGEVVKKSEGKLQLNKHLKKAHQATKILIRSEETQKIEVSSDLKTSSNDEK